MTVLEPVVTWVHAIDDEGNRITVFDVPAFAITTESGELTFRSELIIEAMEDGRYVDGWAFASDEPRRRDALRQMIAGMRQMPYSRSWIALMLCTFILFGWWDDALVWSLGAYWKSPLIVIVYYAAQYLVMIPITLLLSKKTYMQIFIQRGMTEEQAREEAKQLFPMMLKQAVAATGLGKLRARIQARRARRKGGLGTVGSEEEEE